VADALDARSGWYCLCYHLTLREQSYKRLLVGSVVAWTVKSALALVWFWSVYPIEWVVIGLGGLQLLLISV